MDIRNIEDGYSVTGQVRPADIAGIAAAGFKSLVCCRPDNEAEDQPPHAQLREAANALGLAFSYIPLAKGAVPDRQPALLAQALAASSGPVLAYCGSGMRAAAMFERAKALA